jgi:hypothetical protein
LTTIFRAIEIAATTDDNLIELKIIGKLTTEDYALIVGELEKNINKFGKIRLLIELQDFHGWTAGAMWEDIKFDFKHFYDIEKIAVIGENRWEKGMTLFFKPFTRADVRYFARGRLAEALKWIREN